MWSKWMLDWGRKGKIRHADILILVFLVFLFFITIIFIKQIPNAYPILFIYAALLTSLLILIYLRSRLNNKVLEIVDDIIYPVVTILLIFDSMGGLIRYINPVSFDHLLIRMDYIIFNGYPTVALEKITTPFLTEIMQISYASYYFLPVILGMTLKIKKMEQEFDKTIFLIILCFFLSYIGYIIIPAIGPRYTMNHLHEIELKGILLRDIIDKTLNALEGIKRDAFPSGHTAIALVVLYLANRFYRVLFWISLPIVLSLLVSTVYLRYHYVVDVIGGILLFIFTICVGEKIYNFKRE